MERAARDLTETERKENIYTKQNTEKVEFVNPKLPCSFFMLYVFNIVVLTTTYILETLGRFF